MYLEGGAGITLQTEVRKIGSIYQKLQVEEHADKAMAKRKRTQ